MNKRLALCLSLSLALLAGVAAMNAFAQGADAPVGTEIKPVEQQPAAPNGNAGNAGETGTGNTQTAPPTRSEEPSGPWLMFLLIGLLIAMLVFSSRSRKKQEAKRREMLDAIKKGDTVTSIGGIIGTVIELRERDLIIKVDDSTHIKLARWAIRGVGDDSMTEGEKKDGEKK